MSMNTECSTRILLVDDHPMFRWGVSQFISNLSGYELVGEASDGQGALEMVRSRSPHIIFLDLEMPGLNGTGFLSLLSAIEKEKSKIIILSQSTSGSLCRDLQYLGISGYVLKSEGIDEIASALSAVMRNETYFSPGIGKRLWELLQEKPKFENDPVSNRELQIARLVSDGLSTKEIAIKLGCAAPTVKTHRSNLMRKIGAKNSADVVRWIVNQSV